MLDFEQVPSTTRQEALKRSESSHGATRSGSMANRRDWGAKRQPGARGMYSGLFWEEGEGEGRRGLAGGREGGGGSGGRP